jgi:hypothetical protein
MHKVGSIESSYSFESVVKSRKKVSNKFGIYTCNLSAASHIFGWDIPSTPVYNLQWMGWGERQGVCHGDKEVGRNNEYHVRVNVE